MSMWRPPSASALATVAAFCALSVVYHLVVFAIGLWAAMRNDRLLRGAQAARALVDVTPEATYG